MFTLEIGTLEAIFLLPGKPNPMDKLNISASHAAPGTYIRRKPFPQVKGNLFP